jgi:hypothetical protein
MNPWVMAECELFSSIQAAPRMTGRECHGH